MNIDVEAFIAAWNRCGGSPVAVSKLLGLTERSVHRRRAAIMDQYGIKLNTRVCTNSGGSEWKGEGYAYKPRTTITIRDGFVGAFSDCHYWPGHISLAHEALIKLEKILKPKALCANGDIFDGARISRHDPMGWQKLPTVIEELDTCKIRLSEIKRANPRKDCFYGFNMGNHDTRFDRRLATEVSEFEDVPGMSIGHHLGKEWEMSYSLLVNEETDPIFILHNIKGGMHAPFNNIKAAGCHVITGHLHSQKVMPFTNLFKTWEGIDAGCLACVNSPAFSYGMDRPADHRSGFVMVWIDENGFAYPADLCRVQYLKDKQRAIFRGEVVCERANP